MDLLLLFTAADGIRDGHVTGVQTCALPISFFNWVHLWNTGAAFSLFANGGGWQRYFFIGIAVVVSIFLINLILENRHKGEAIAYSIILGGAMGNLIDRVFRGYVVDSFDFYWRDWHWPAFNRAVIAIFLV